MNGASWLSRERSSSSRPKNPLCFSWQRPLKWQYMIATVYRISETVCSQPWCSTFILFHDVNYLGTETESPLTWFCPSKHHQACISRPEQTKTGWDTQILSKFSEDPALILFFNMIHCCDSALAWPRTVTECLAAPILRMCSQKQLVCYKCSRAPEKWDDWNPTPKHTGCLCLSS